MASPALDPALTTEAPRPSNDEFGNSRPRQHDDHRESVVGRAADPWRIGQTGHHALGANRVAAPGATAPPAVTNVADVSHQSCRHARVDGLLHRADLPEDTAPPWLLRDRDAIYGDVFRRRVASMGIGEVVSSPSSPWQNPYAERLIGSIRRECLNHVIVLGEGHLQRLLTAYLTYYHGARTHLALEKDAPTPRRVQVPTEGRVVAFPEVGGLHHRYERRAA